MIQLPKPLPETIALHVSAHVRTATSLIFHIPANEPQRAAEDGPVAWASATIWEGDLNRAPGTRLQAETAVAIVEHLSLPLVL